MGHVILIAGGLLFTLIGVFLTNDLYACAKPLQRQLLRFAARLLPTDQQNEAYSQWYGDLFTLPPSEILRTLYALDCIRGSAVLSIRSRRAAKFRASNGESSNAEREWDELISNFAVKKGWHERVKRVIDFIIASMFLLSIIPI